MIFIYVLLFIGLNDKTTYGLTIITNFYDKNGYNKIPKEKVPHKCLSIIILDSVIYAYEKYYPQTFLEEYKCVKENIKSKNYIDMELKPESDNDSDSDSDNNSDSYSDSDNDNDNENDIDIDIEE